jgi:nucleotide-binding universal stress UspA family protein
MRPGFVVLTESLWAHDRPLGRILLPVGGTGRPSIATSVAIRVASRTGGQVRLVHARIWDPPAPGDPPCYAETVEESDLVLELAVHQVRAAGLRSSAAVVSSPRSHVATAIAVEAASWDADVIVMAQRAKGRLGELFTRHLADEVARRTACPIIVVSQ